MRIAVGSTSQHKLHSTQEVCSRIFGGDALNVEGFKVASGINEQPFGHEETLQGAQNRLAALIQATESDTRYDLFVAMEGGLFQVGTAYYECGWVVVRDCDGNQARAHCAGMQYPQEKVFIAQNKGFVTTTVGSVLADAIGGDGTDPQTTLTSGLVERTEILSQALKIAIGQLLRKSVSLGHLCNSESPSTLNVS